MEDNIINNESEKETYLFSKNEQNRIFFQSWKV